MYVIFRIPELRPVSPFLKLTYNEGEGYDVGGNHGKK